MYVQRITPCLWFDFQAEEAARFYCDVFSNSRILRISRYGDAGHEIHGRPSGSVMTAMFELDGQTFTALNGGPVFRFNEVISLQVNCDTQEELDHYWNRLSAGGDESAQLCGWLKDKYGVSWQIIPAALADMMADSDPRKTERVMTALLKMKRLDISTLQRAFEET
jgi:predicted 3-demethylubiquinone-9 3-methyltransferase (glyoxalase superfamily)